MHGSDTAAHTSSADAAVSSSASENGENAAHVERQQVTKLMSARLGEIVGLLMRTSTHSHLSLRELEWLVLPALKNNQISVAYAKHDPIGINVPVGMVSWAFLSDEVEGRLVQDLDKPFRLGASEWKSGDNLWVIDAVGTPQVISEQIRSLCANALKGKTLKLRSLDKDGKRFIQTVDADK